MTRSTTLALCLALNGAAFAATQMAYGEEADVCRTYAAKFAVIFKTLTDHNLNPFYQDKVYWRCANVETPPPDLAGLGTMPAAGAIPASPGQTESPKAGSTPSGWEATCARRYRSWDPATKTVIKYRTHRRIPCPVKH